MQKSETRHEDYGPFGFIEKLEAEKLNHVLCTFFRFVHILGDDSGNVLVRIYLYQIFFGKAWGTTHFGTCG